LATHLSHKRDDQAYYIPGWLNVAGDMSPVSPAAWRLCTSGWYVAYDFARSWDSRRIQL